MSENESESEPCGSGVVKVDAVNLDNIIGIVEVIRGIYK